MRKVLSLMLALILVLTSCMTMTFLVVSADDVTYGVLFNGLPSEGTTKTENGVNFEAKVDTAGYGSIENNTGIITMTTAGTYKALDTKLTYGVNNTAEGKVKYSFYVATFASVPSLYVKFYTGGTDTMCANFSLAANSSNTIVFEYDPASGSYVMTINGETKGSGTVDPSKGIDSVYFRAMSSTGNGETVQLTNAKVEHIAPPMTGYGTYFEGLPKDGETTAEKNGVKITSPVAAADGKITLTPPTPSNRLDTKIAFAANNTTLEGIVTYTFDVTTGSASPELMFGINNLDLNGHRAFFEQNATANTNYVIEFKYNTQTAEYSLKMNGVDKTPSSLYKPTASEGITDVTLAAYKGSASTVVINKIKVVYDPMPMTGYGTYFEGLPEDGRTAAEKNGVQFTSPVAVANDTITLNPVSNRIGVTLAFPANNTLNGTVTYSVEFTTGNPASQLMVGFNNLEASGHRLVVDSNLAVNTDYKVDFVYNTATAEYKILLNGAEKSKPTYQPTAAEGITDVTFAAYSPSTGSFIIKNAKVTYEAPPMTGYGTYLEGVPESGVTKTQNGASLTIQYDGGKEAVNNGNGIEITTNGGWSGGAVIPTLNFAATNELEGIVTYEFTVLASGTLPQAMYLRPNNDKTNYNFPVVSGSGDGYINVFDGYTKPEELEHNMVLGNEYTLGIAYNTNTGDVAVMYNGYISPRPDYNSSLEGSSLSKLNTETGLSNVCLAIFAGSADSVIYLKDVKITYSPLDSAEDIDVKYDSETKKANATVSVTKASYFSSLDKSATLYVAAYCRDELVALGVQPVNFTDGESEYGASVDLTNITYDKLDAFLWRDNDLYPISSAK